jgi:hypothetical protein
MININHLKFISKDLYFVQYVMVLALHDVLDQHTEFDFYSASSLKHQSSDRHVAPLGHIILMTALHWACSKGHLDAVKLLMEYRAFPNHMEFTEDR